MTIDSNDSLVPFTPQPPVQQGKQPIQKAKLKVEPPQTLNETRTNLRRASMNPLAASRWKSLSKVGKFISEQGTEEIALAYLANQVSKLELMIKQCEETLAKPHTEFAGAAAQRTIINATAELTKICTCMQSANKTAPVDPNAGAQKSPGPPPRSAVTAQQVNVFVDKKVAP